MRFNQSCAGKFCNNFIKRCSLAIPEYKYSQFVQNNYESLEVHQKDKGIRLDRFLLTRGVKWASIHRSLRNKYYYVLNQENKVIKDPGYRLQTNDKLYFRSNSDFSPDQPSEDSFYKLPRDKALKELQRMTIFQNDRIIVLNKPAGYSTQGGQDFDNNLFTILISAYDRSNIHILHRLDLPCTGVVMFGKGVEASRIVQKAITSRDTVHKFYLAKTMKQAPRNEGLIDCHIDWNDNKRKSRLSSPTIPNSQPAMTYYRKVAGDNQNGYYYLIKLITGRKHQIRCHFSNYLQAPIANDLLYGAPKMLGAKQQNGIYLHSFVTVFTDPVIKDSIFKDQTVQNQRGSIVIKQNNVFIQGKIPWADKVNLPKQEKLYEAIQSLLNYQPKIARGKFISY